MKDFAAYENSRNKEHSDLYKAIIRKAFGKDDDVIVAHHLCYSIQDGDEFRVEEIPSADTLIFDHEIAKKIWGVNKAINTTLPQWQANLIQLAFEPTETRDALLNKLWCEAECRK